MKKRWLIAAALVAGAACAETTTKDINRNKSENTLPSSAGTNSDSKLPSQLSDQIEDDTISEDCGPKKEGHAP